MAGRTLNDWQKAVREMSDKLCKTCGKAPLANRAGSVTSYFFQHNYCQCNRTRPAVVSDNQVCSNCGKSRPASRRVGSFTSFLFKELRCQCAGPAASKKAPGGSSQRTATAQRLTQRKQFTQLALTSAGQSGQAGAQKVLPADSIIGGSFRIIKMIGMGGMGVVYLAEQTSLRKQVALKILAPELVNEQSWLRFQAEAKTLAVLNHATLVKVYDLGIHDRSLPFYSMDYLVGRNLEEILIEDGPLSFEQALPIFVEVLSGLAYAHRNGIIHRDLKPGNIMICTTGSAEQVKILDFGISKLVTTRSGIAQSLTSTGEVFGSPYYMSPEQCEGDVVDARSDIYSIGCSLFEVLTGYVPFEGRSSVETVTMHQDRDPPRLSDVSSDCDFPPSLELVLAKCLAKLPQDRYQSAKELSLDLERIVEGKDVLVYTRSFSSATNPQSSEQSESGGLPLRLLVTVALLLGGGMLAAYFLLQAKSTPEAESASVSQSATRADETKNATDSYSHTSADSLIDVASGRGPSATVAASDHVKQQSDSGYDNFVAIVGDASQNIGTFSGDQSDPKGSQFETAKYATVKVVKGQRMISFNFPTDVVIGKLYIEHGDPGVDARGVIECRYGTPLTFMPSRLVGKYPQYMKRFGPEDLHGVLIYPNAGDDKVLQAVTNLPNIDFLSVIANTELTPTSVASFNKFKNLRTFDASSSYLSGTMLASANCWSKLVQLYWSSPKDPSPFLKKLQASPDLAYLKLSGASLSHEDYLLIAKMANLRRIDLSTTKIAAVDLLALSSLEKLTSLNLRECQIGKDAIPILKEFKSLRDLEIVGETSSPVTVAALRRALPGVRIH
jgi:serine/threonine-protein kinase